MPLLSVSGHQSSGTICAWFDLRPPRWVWVLALLRASLPEVLATIARANLILHLILISKHDWWWIWDISGLTHSVASVLLIPLFNKALRHEAPYNLPRLWIPPQTAMKVCKKHSKPTPSQRLEFLQWQNTIKKTSGDFEWRKHTWEDPNGALSFFLLELLLHWNAHQNRRSDSPPSASWSSSRTCGWMQEEKNSSQGGAHKITPWSTAQFCPGPVPAPTHRHRLQRAFEGYPDQIFAHSKRIVAGRCVNMAWQCMEGNVRQRHAHWSFQRITRALFVFTLNAAAANLYSLYSLCRLKPAQKSSDPRPWIWHGTQFRNSIRTASDGPSKWKRLCKMKCWDCKRWNRVKRTSPVLTRAQRLSWEAQYHVIRLSFLNNHLRPPCNASSWYQTRSHRPSYESLQNEKKWPWPTLQKIHRSRATQLWIVRPVYLPKKRLYIISFHCNSYLLLIYFFDSVPQGYASNPHKRQNHVIMY